MHSAVKLLAKHRIGSKSEIQTSSRGMNGVKLSRSQPCTIRGKRCCIVSTTPAKIQGRAADSATVDLGTTALSLNQQGSLGVQKETAGLRSSWREALWIVRLLAATTGSFQSDSIGFFQGQQEHTNPHKKANTTSNPSTFTKDLQEFTHLSKIELEPATHLSIPPWKIKNINTDLSLAEIINKQNDSSVKQKSLAIDKIDLIQNAIEIYTDGSKSEDNKVGYAFYIPQYNHTFNSRITDNLSLFTEL